jgi:hypothetical protein
MSIQGNQYFTKRSGSLGQHLIDDKAVLSSQRSVTGIIDATNGVDAATYCIVNAAREAIELPYGAIVNQILLSPNGTVNIVGGTTFIVVVGTTNIAGVLTTTTALTLSASLANANLGTSPTLVVADASKGLATTYVYVGVTLGAAITAGALKVTVFYTENPAPDV